MPGTSDIIMSAETRAVMREMVSDLQAKSTDYWEFRAEGADRVTVARRDRIAFTVVARAVNVELWFHHAVLESHFVPDWDGPEFHNHNRMRLIGVGRNMDLGVEDVDGRWMHTFSPANYAMRKAEVLNLMLLSQASVLLLLGA